MFFREGAAIYPYKGHKYKEVSKTTGDDGNNKRQRVEETGSDAGT